MEFQKVSKKPTASLNEDNEVFRVGMLRKNNNLQEYTTANLMAYMAKNFNIELYFFTPKNFDPTSKTINAVLIEGGKKTKRTIPLPKIVYDMDGAYYNKAVQNLLKDECNLFQYGWGAHKKKVYDMISANGHFKEFLIETHMLKNFDTFFPLFKQYHCDVVLKPDGGSLGEGVVRVVLDDNKYVIVLPKSQISLESVTELKDYYEENFTKRPYVLQPYIISRTKYGNPFDIRVHARRGAGGEFKFLPYPRFGRNPEGILSNISAGGYTMPILKFLKQEYGDDWKMIFDRMIDFAKNISELVQSSFAKTIFAMGIDIGIQRRNDSYELKLFEINTFNPGISSIPIEAAFITLEYMQYLGKKMANEALQKT